jgi:hypothetical protein
MLSFDVVWNGGPLLPPRPERTAALFSDTPGEAESVERTVRTGRYCKCGCGQELVYSSTTRQKKREKASQFKAGHALRMRVHPERQCRGCKARFTPEVGSAVTTFCTTSCAGKYYRQRRKAISGQGTPAVR